MEGKREGRRTEGGRSTIGTNLRSIMFQVCTRAGGIPAVRENLQFCRWSLTGPAAIFPFYQTKLFKKPNKLVTKSNHTCDQTKLVTKPNLGPNQTWDQTKLGTNKLFTKQNHTCDPTKLFTKPNQTWDQTKLGTKSNLGPNQTWDQTKLGIKPNLGSNQTWDQTKPVTLPNQTCHQTKPYLSPNRTVIGIKPNLGPNQT